MKYSIIKPQCNSILRGQEFMGYVQSSLVLLIIIFVYIAIMEFYMKTANYIGEKLRIGKFFIYLWQKIRGFK